MIRELIALRGNKSKARQGSRRVNYPSLQSGETLGWSVVGATPTLRTKLTSADAFKVRKKFGNVHKKIKTDS